ncbi:hypothetical protein ACIRU3_38280 [Streptomyces sp. NPDC101151]|uniref:hypothetical protein n=1 Tax=Streptomyces sp. NPDC101151 TaxID=3366115 RepID=UPI003801B89C
MTRWHRIAPDLMTVDERNRLYREAGQYRPDAELKDRRGYSVVNGTQLLSPARNRFAEAGAHRDDLHTKVLPRRLARLLGHPVRPSVSCYLYYGPDDHLGLHTDQRVCPLTVLVLLSGDAGPLHTHPELSDVPVQTLLRLSRKHGGHPPGGNPLSLQDGPLLLQGSRIPHHRLPHRGPGELSLATFCFGT